MANGNGRVLLISSHAEETDALRALLTPVPVEIVVVPGAQAALRLLRHQRFHVVVATLGAAREDRGVEALTSLLGNREDTAPTIVVAEHADARLVDRLRAAGAFDVLSMPTERGAVVEVVRRALLRRGLRVLEDTTGPVPDPPVRQVPFLVGTSEPMRELLHWIAKAAASDATVCVFGETGTGKELVARAIHYASRRAKRPLLVFDCTAVPDGLMESELFGHVKGAFTSAVADRDGVLQLAHGGSLLLDEIGDLGPSLQAKLLRVMQSREFRKVGGKELIQVDVRIIAATHKSLADLVRTGAFREDLFYRLDVLTITVPPLRERTDDIPLLVDHVIERFNRNNQRRIQGVHPKAMEALLRYHWPGNVRELENCIERAAVMADGPILTIEDPRQLMRPARLAANALGDSDETSRPLTLKEVETHLLRTTLQRVGENKALAAGLLGISLRTLYYKLEALERAAIRPAGTAAGEQARLAQPATPLAADADRPREPGARSRCRKPQVPTISSPPSPGLTGTIP